VPISDKERKHACCLCRWLEWGYLGRFDLGQGVTLTLGVPIAVGVCMKDPEAPFVASQHCGESEAREIEEDETNDGTKGGT